MLRVKIKNKIYTNSNLLKCELFAYCNEMNISDNEMNSDEIIDIDSIHFDAFMMICNDDYSYLDKLLINCVQFHRYTCTLKPNKRMIAEIEKLHLSFSYFGHKEILTHIYEKLLKQIVKYYRYPLKVYWVCCMINYKGMYLWDISKFRFYCPYCYKENLIGKWKKNKENKESFEKMYNMKIFSFDNIWKKPLEIHLKNIDKYQSPPLNKMYADDMIER